MVCDAVRPERNIPVGSSSVAKLGAVTVIAVVVHTKTFQKKKNKDKIPFSKQLLVCKFKAYTCVIYANNNDNQPSTL